VSHSSNGVGRSDQPTRALIRLDLDWITGLSNPPPTAYPIYKNMIADYGRSNSLFRNACSREKIENIFGLFPASKDAHASGLSKGALVGIIVAAVIGSLLLATIAFNFL
jgi:hypothetical protein